MGRARGTFNRSVRSAVGGRRGLCWLAALSVAGVVLSPTGTGAAPAPPDQVQTVTCPDVGSLPVSLSRGVSTSPLPPGLDLNVSYQAVDTRTRATVSGGQPPGA